MTAQDYAAPDVWAVMAAGAIGIVIALAAVAVALVATVVWCVPGAWRAAVRSSWTGLRVSAAGPRVRRVSVTLGAPHTGPLAVDRKYRR